MSVKKKFSVANVFFDTIGAIIPSCGPALRMVELAQERPLKIGERILLFYNSPLCLHCSCNRAKFKEERAKAKKLEVVRRSLKKEC